MELIIRGLELRGAYGRDATLADWKSGKDFKITNGPYCSIRDLEEMRREGFHIVEIFNNAGTLLKRIELVKLPNGGSFSRVH